MWMNKLRGVNPRTNFVDLVGYPAARNPVLPYLQTICGGYKCFGYQAPDIWCPNIRSPNIWWTGIRWSGNRPIWYPVHPYLSAAVSIGSEINNLYMLDKWPFIRSTRKTIVLISDGNSWIGAHVRVNLSFLTCKQRLVREQAQIRYFYPKIPIFLHVCATFKELPSMV